MIWAMDETYVPPLAETYIPPSGEGSLAPPVSGGLAGQEYGPYQILEEIARGGQGAVFRAKHMQLGTTVALKVLLDPEPRAVRRFQQEAQILARLSHPNIPTVTDLGEISGRPYLAMEYVHGPDLKEVVKSGGLPTPERTVEVLREVARALQYCHEMGIVHRDLKPANVLIEENGGRVLLVDFGLVKRDAKRFAIHGEGGSALQGGASKAAPSAGVSGTEVGELSEAGEIKGTPSFMAPEQADPSFGGIGPRTDVYGLGATLHFLLCGEAPIRAATAFNAIARLMKDPPGDPSRVNPQAHPQLAALCRRALGKTPDERPASAAAFADALTGALHARARRARAWGFSLLMLAVGALGVGSAAYAWASRPDPWAVALDALGAGRALTGAELESLADAGPEAKRWLPFARAESALIGGSVEPLLEGLPAGAEAESSLGRAGDLLRFEATFRSEDFRTNSPEVMERSLELMSSGALAQFPRPWRQAQAVDRWTRLANALETQGQTGLAARAWIEVAAQHYRQAEAETDSAARQLAGDVWVRHAFSLDPRESARHGGPVAKYLLATSVTALAAAVKSPDPDTGTTLRLDPVAESVRAARERLEFLRRIKPGQRFPAQVLANLFSLASRRLALRLAAMPSMVHFDSAHRAEIQKLLSTPLTPAELDVMDCSDAGRRTTWPSAWRKGTIGAFPAEHWGAEYRLKAYRDWILWRPEHQGLWWVLGKMEQARQDYRAAERVWEVALARERQGRAALEFELGRCLYRQRHFAGSIQAFERSLKEDKGVAFHTLRELAEALIVAGRPDEALTILDEMPSRLGPAIARVIQKQSTQAGLLRIRADAYARLGDFERADECRQRAVAMRSATR
jgi:serine/threonine protein kinase/tetratricopeptide (TPR) repeat protein